MKNHHRLNVRVNAALVGFATALQFVTTLQFATTLHTTILQTFPSQFHLLFVLLSSIYIYASFFPLLLLYD